MVSKSCPILPKKLSFKKNEIENLTKRDIFSRILNEQESEHNINKSLKYVINELLNLFNIKNSEKMVKSNLERNIKKIFKKWKNIKCNFKKKIEQVRILQNT